LVTALTDAIRPVFSIAAVAFGLGRGVGQVFVLACAMPAAVTPLLLTVEYDTGGEGITGPEYVSTAILLSTVGSVGTLTLLLFVLRSGLLF
jgi:predicted permease